MKNTLILSLVALAVISAQADAETLISDSFNYTTGASINGATFTGTGTAYAGTETWSVSNAAANLNANVLSGSLSYSGLSTSGGHLDVYRSVGAGSATSSILMEAATGQSNTTFTDSYMAFLINTDSANFGSGGSITLGWDHNSTSAGRFHSLIFDNSGISLFEAGVPNTFVTGLTLNSGTNLVVLRVTDKSNGSNDEFQIWLNPTNLSSLGTANYTRNTSYGLVVNNASYGYDFVRIDNKLAEGSSVLIDELRLGTTLTDVFPVPEPSTYALVAGSLVLLGLLRRNRKA